MRGVPKNSSAAPTSHDIAELEARPAVSYKGPWRHIGRAVTRDAGGNTAATEFSQKIGGVNLEPEGTR